MTEPDPTSLDVLLVRTARAIPTPNPASFAAAVAERLRSQPSIDPGPRPAPGRRRRIVVVPAALVAVCAVAATMIPAVRSGVADLLGIDRGQATQAAPPIPTPAATTPPTIPATIPTTTPTSGSPADPVAALHLGTPTTLKQAARLVGFTMRLPTIDGYQQPDAVLVASPPAGGMASMVYLPKAGRPTVAGRGVAALLSEFRGHLEASYFQTLAGNGTDVQAVQVGGARGFWLPSGPHQFPYVRPDGTVESETIRLATNTLLWSVGGITYRFESAGSRVAAIAIAVSMR